MKDRGNAHRIVPIVLAACLGVLLLGTLSCATGNKGGGSSQPTVADVHMTQADSSSSANAVEKDYSALARQVQNTIASYGGDVAVEFISLMPEGGSFSIRGTATMLSASMLKIPILTCLLDEIAMGNVSLDEICVVQASNVVGGTGTGLVAGQQLSVEELARLMIAESDNTASNTIIALLGEDKLNTYFQTHGLDQTAFDHSFMARNPAGDNLTSAHDLATLLKQIATSEMATDELCAMAQGFLLQQSDDEAMARGVPARMKVGHKTGSLSSARHDGGIIYDSTGEPLCVLVVLTQGMDEYNANRLIAQVTKIVCEGS